MGGASGKENLLRAFGKSIGKERCRSFPVCVHMRRDRGDRGLRGCPCVWRPVAAGGRCGAPVAVALAITCSTEGGNASSWTSARLSSSGLASRELEGSEVQDKTGARSQHGQENSKLPRTGFGQEGISGLDYWPKEKPMCLKRRGLYSLDQIIKKIFFLIIEQGP